ncbi:MAG TPA: DUF1116 domain-containing protein [bacterium]|nr:DUF1116 domain-containing protein [bacterium]HPN43943.1 DUF1116 domain-containing protein [bacterium]
MNKRLLKQIKIANETAVERIFNSEPVLYDLRRANQVIPGMQRNMILHAGPPLLWEEMTGALKGAIIGAIIFEGWAKSKEEALKIASSGLITYSSTHDHNSVAPMTGVISPSMNVFCVKNITYGNFSYCNLNEGLGHVLRFGAYDDTVIQHLKWVNEWVALVFKKAVYLSGPISLKPIMIEAMQKGDECHNRHVAGNGLFIDIIRPYLIKMDMKKTEINKVLEFIESNYYSFLNLSLAACKATADVTNDIPYCTLVWALSRNGKDTGIRVSGLNTNWYSAKSDIPDGRFFNGYSKSNANPDMGDSTITETVGIGAFAMGAAPEIVSYLGGQADDVIKHSYKMYDITYSENQNFKIPQFGLKGTPTGIDILKVVETKITPIINTGIAHKDGGVGQIGAGLVYAPIECFENALHAFEEKYGKI